MRRTPLLALILAFAVACGGTTDASPGDPVESDAAATRLTEEGRPVSETFTYVGTGRIQVYVDSKDSLGREGTFRYECSGTAPDARQVITFMGCTAWAPVGGTAVPQPERP